MGKEELRRFDVRGYNILSLGFPNKSRQQISNHYITLYIYKNIYVYIDTDGAFHLENHTATNNIGQICLNTLMC